MMEDSKIFNLSDLSDLPDEIKEKFRSFGFGSDTLNLLSLFDIKNELTVPEMMVGMYRKFNTLKSRLWFNSAVYRLKNKKKITKVAGTKDTFKKIC